MQEPKTFLFDGQTKGGSPFEVLELHRQMLNAQDVLHALEVHLFQQVDLRAQQLADRLSSHFTEEGNARSFEKTG